MTHLSDEERRQNKAHYIGRMAARHLRDNAPTDRWDAWIEGFLGELQTLDVVVIRNNREADLGTSLAELYGLSFLERLGAAILAQHAAHAVAIRAALAEPLE